MAIGSLKFVPWLAQLVVAIFFTSGFVNFYFTFWRQAFGDHHCTGPMRMVARSTIVLLSFSFSFLFYIMGRLVAPDAMLFANLSLYVLLFPLFDSRINLLEYGVRCFGVTALYTWNFSGHLQTINFGLALLVLWLILGATWLLRKYIYYQYWPTMLVLLLLAWDYWLVPLQGGQYAKLPIMQAVIMYVVMCMYTTFRRYQEHRLLLYEQKMTELADYDTLTKAKTYSLYQRDLTRLFQEAKDQQTPLTLVTVDVDHFKSVNDTYGHLAGNMVLAGIVALIQRSLAQGADTAQLYRTGGEEFTMIFPGKKTGQVLALVQDCFQAVRGYTFVYGNKQIHTTISVGMTDLLQTDDSIDTIFRRADESLYASKRGGRNQITIDGRQLTQRSSQA